jgi:D-alanyl-D-alanine carboxypeptidase (penicillin-binding protein 5/6)
VTLVRALVVAVALAAAAPSVAEAAAPSIQAPAAILIEPTSSDVVFQRQPDRRRPIASTTKLMTALLTLERLPLNRKVVVQPYVATPAESTANLAAGERLTVADLLRALLLESANEAAKTLAIAVDGSQEAFVGAMNRRADELRLDNTEYANPIGLDDSLNYSTPRDLVTLTERLRRFKFFRATVGNAKLTIRTGAHPRKLGNTNSLVGSKLGNSLGVDGVKTGHTAIAGYVLVGSATHQGVTLLSAVIGDPSKAARDADTAALLAYGFSRYRRVTLFRHGEVVRRANVRYRPEQDVDLVAPLEVKRVLRTTAKPVVTIAVPTTLTGPLDAGARVGTATVRANGRVVARTPIVTGAAVPKVGYAERLGRRLVETGTLILIAFLGILAAAGALMLTRRRMAEEIQT